MVGINNNGMSKNPIFCAIDMTDIAVAKQLIGDIAPHVGGIKLGLEFFTAHGVEGVKRVMPDGVPLFLDLKFHDIPNTVVGAVRAALPLAPFMMTVHTMGGYDMMKAAANAAKEHAAAHPLILGVTVLTSMDGDDLAEIGVGGIVADQVKRLAALAQKAGLGGVVCSPHEIEVLRRECGKDFTLVVPGIRPAGSSHGDQKRVMTPKEALGAGATYLVIGRPITGASDPKAAAAGMLEG